MNQLGEMTTSRKEYAQAYKILESCPHPHDAYNAWCCECWNAYVYKRREIRKRELAAFKKTLPACHRCGVKPGNWNLAGHPLCGKCKNLTAREHHAVAAGFGVMAIFGVGQLFTDTSAWAYRKGE